MRRKKELCLIQKSVFIAEKTFMQDHTKLRVFEMAHEQVLSIYRLTEELPDSERFHLTSQIRRSATSISTNIVEGCCRRTSKDKAHFFQIAYGSAGELLYQLSLLRDLKYISPEKYETLRSNALPVKKMLNGLVVRMRKQRS